MAQLLNRSKRGSYRSMSHSHLDGFPLLLVDSFHRILILTACITMGQSEQTLLSCWKKDENRIDQRGSAPHGKVVLRLWLETEPICVFVRAPGPHPASRMSWGSPHFRGPEQRREGSDSGTMWVPTPRPCSVVLSHHSWARVGMTRD